MACLLDSFLIISNICLVDSLCLLEIHTPPYSMHTLLSLQFLAEDYTLVDVLYYVTRDDLKCLRLRYHFFPLTFGCHEGKNPGLRTGSLGSCPAGSLTSSAGSGRAVSGFQPSE